jgi:hypothetical protein
VALMNATRRTGTKVMSQDRKTGQFCRRSVVGIFSQHEAMPPEQQTLSA